jgi:acyl-CoA thioesterase I
MNVLTRFLLLCVLGLSSTALAHCVLKEEPINITEYQPEVDSIPVRYLALGDSYTIGEDVPESDRFPNQLASHLDSLGFQVDSLLIIAKTGWTTAQLLQALEDQNPDSAWSYITLLIGVNNQYRGLSTEQYGIEFERLLDRAIASCENGRKGIAVLSIPDYGVTPFGKKRPNANEISDQIDSFNAIKRDICKIKGVDFFDITTISRQAESDLTLLASDQLHPSGRMYNLWVSEFAAQCAAVHTSIK